MVSPWSFMRIKTRPQFSGLGMIILIKIKDRSSSKSLAFHLNNCWAPYPSNEKLSIHLSWGWYISSAKHLVQTTYKNSCIDVQSGWLFRVSSGDLCVCLAYMKTTTKTATPLNRFPSSITLKVKDMPSYFRLTIWGREALSFLVGDKGTRPFSSPTIKFKKQSPNIRTPVTLS